MDAQGEALGATSETAEENKKTGTKESKGPGGENLKTVGKNPRFGDGQSHHFRISERKGAKL